MASTKKEFDIRTASRLSDIGEYYFSQKLQQIARYNQAGRNVINLGIGSPDLPPHPSVVEALTRTAQRADAHGYQSYRSIPALREAFAKWYERYFSVRLDSESEILPLIGSKEGIMHVCMTFLNEGDQVLIPNPGYPTYLSAVKLAGGVPVPYHLSSDNDWQIDMDELERLDTSKVKMMWLNYPHMPSGALAKEGLFEQVIDFGRRKHILICHDNPYGFILNPHRPQSILAIPNAKEVCIELNSLSKSHNMAGWRIGMMASNSHFINEIIKFKSNMDSGIFLGLQQAAIQALSLGDEWFTDLNAIYQKRKQKVMKIMHALGCQVEEGSVGLFVWGRVPATYKDGFDMADDILEKKNVFITPGGIFGDRGNGFIRISLCATEEKLDEANQRILSV